MKTFLTITFISLVSIANCYSQSLDTDTLHIRFDFDTIIPVNYNIVHVVDYRKPDSRHIAYHQTKKFYFIPVDQVVMTDCDFSTQISQHLSTNTKSDSCSLGIEYFYIEKYNGRLSSPLVLKANIRIDSVTNGKSKYMGTLIYNNTVRPPKKTQKTDIYENMLLQWSRDLKLDLIEIANAHKTIVPKNLPSRLVTESLRRPNFANLTTAVVIGNGFWQLEGEFYFTRPQTTERRWFKSNMIRYQNTTDYEAIFYGRKSEHIHQPLKENILFDMSTHLFIGINKWKETEEVKLWDIIQLSASSSQTLNYELKNKQGFIFKLGAFENIAYIYDRDIILQFGAYIGIGYKL